MSDLLTFVCWKWTQPGCRSSYTAQHVNVFRNMISRNVMMPHRIICVTDDPKGITCETYPLWNDFNTISNPNGSHLPSCFRRLKLFDGATTDAMGIPRDSKVISLDLDIVILKDITVMYTNYNEAFTGWKRISPSRPIEYNGSMWMLRAGRMQDVWDNFNPIRSPLIARRQKHYGSDQGWISYYLRGAYPGWTRSDGMYSYSSDVYKRIFPKNARIISFNGKHKPDMGHVQVENPWIRHYYR